MDEKFISEYFAGLPRKPLVLAGKKELIWQKVQMAMQKSRSVETAVPVLAWPLKRLAYATVALVLVLAAGTVAARNSLPGETLYPVKRAAERVEKTLAVTEAKKVEVLTDHSETRLKEVVTLVKEKKVSEQVVVKTLSDLKTTNSELRSAAIAVSQKKPELVEKVIELASAEQVILSEVKEKVEGEAKLAAEEIITIAQESVTLLKSVSGGQVEGAAQGEEEGEQPAATTTAPSSGTRGSAPKSGEIKSDIQIDEVIKSNDISGEEEPAPNQEPEILPEPGN